MRAMTTPRAILIATAALIIAAAVLAWFAVPRYSLVNLGRGATMRLDRSSGEMVYCIDGNCAPSKQVSAVDPYAGFTPVEQGTPNSSD